jgi:protein-arginine kinase activator protein McsA
LALAVRFGCPIYTYDHILESAGILMEDTSKGKKSDIPVDETSAATREELGKMSMEELQNLLNEVLDQEDYLRAIAIRDEINKRK